MWICAKTENFFSFVLCCRCCWCTVAVFYTNVCVFSLSLSLLSLFVLASVWLLDYSPRISENKTIFFWPLGNVQLEQAQKKYSSIRMYMACNKDEQNKNHIYLRRYRRQNDFFSLLFRSLFVCLFERFFLLLLCLKRSKKRCYQTKK